MTFPGNWQLAWVNQETLRCRSQPLIMLMAIANIASSKPI